MHKLILQVRLHFRPSEELEKNTSFKVKPNKEEEPSESRLLPCVSEKRLVIPTTHSLCSIPSFSFLCLLVLGLKWPPLQLCCLPPSAVLSDPQSLPSTAVTHAVPRPAHSVTFLELVQAQRIGLRKTQMKSNQELM